MEMTFFPFAYDSQKIKKLAIHKIKFCVDFAEIKFCKFHGGSFFVEN